MLAAGGGPIDISWLSKHVLSLRHALLCKACQLRSSHDSIYNNSRDNSGGWILQQKAKTKSSYHCVQHSLLSRAACIAALPHHRPSAPGRSGA